MNFANLSLVADERHNGVKLPVLLKIFLNKQEFVSMFEKIVVKLQVKFFLCFLKVIL